MQQSPILCENKPTLTPHGLLSVSHQPFGSQHVGQVERTEQHVLTQRREAPEGLPGVREDVVLEEDAVLQAGGQADVAAHDVDAVVVQRARQVQARLGRVLLQLDPLPRGDVVGLHRQHILRLAGTPLAELQLVGVAAHQEDGVLHREHLLLADVRRTRAKHRPGVRGGAVTQDACVPVCQRENGGYTESKE